MLSIKILLLFLLLSFNLNFTHANEIPDEIAAVCGLKTCDLVFSKMKKFAKNGSPHAQAVLSLLYRGGYGTEVNHDLSVTYIKRAAKAGLGYAQYNLGVLFKTGYLVDKDEEEGDYWIKRSAKNRVQKSY